MHELGLTRSIVDLVTQVGRREGRATHASSAASAAWFSASSARFCSLAISWLAFQPAILSAVTAFRFSTQIFTVSRAAATLARYLVDASLQLAEMVADVLLGAFGPRIDLRPQAAEAAVDPGELRSQVVADRPMAFPLSNR
jgi:hypothetical protein